MKISTRGRYGLRLMVDIAIHAGDTPVTLREVAARQEISEKYLEQIILKLARAGYVRGTRGARGGYVLSCPPEQITAGDILRVVENGLTPVDCVNRDNTCSCDKADSCITIDLWRDIKKAVDEVVDQRTLADLAKLYRSRNADKAP